MSAQVGESGRRGDPPAVEPSWEKLGVRSGGFRIRQHGATSADHFEYVVSDQTRPPRADALKDLLAQLATARSPTPASRAQSEPSGPVKFVLKLLESWELRKEDAIQLLGFDHVDASHVNDVLEGTRQLRGRDPRDRIAHLFQIYSALSALFRDPRVENEWLRERHTLLDGKEPMALLLGGSMEDLLLVREYVDAAAGR